MTLEKNIFGDIQIKKNDFLTTCFLNSGPVTKFRN